MSEIHNQTGGTEQPLVTLAEELPEDAKQTLQQVAKDVRAARGTQRTRSGAMRYGTTAVACCMLMAGLAVYALAARIFQKD